MSSEERESSKGIGEAGFNGRFVLNKEQGRIEIYNASDELVMTVGVGDDGVSYGIILSDGTYNRLTATKEGIVILDADGNEIIGLTGEIDGARLKNASITNAKINDLSADKLNAGTITGRKYQTASSGARVSLNDGWSGTSNNLIIFDANTPRMILDSGGISFIDENGDDAGSISGYYYGTWSVPIITIDAFLRVINDMAVAGPLTCESDLMVLGSKDFNIPHPTKEGKRLVYSCIEAPEVLVFCRGIIDNADDEIILPQHFIDISEKNTIQIQVGKLYKSKKYAWTATGVRLGYLNKETEPDAKDSNLQILERQQKLAEGVDRLNARRAEAVKQKPKKPRVPKPDQ